jgi:micrococcal nuclease
MKIKIIDSSLTIIFLGSMLIVVIPNTQIDATTDNDECNSSYPDACIQSPPPNLNCGDISDKRFEVLPPDPHGFDRDEDGIGCES